MLAKNKLLRLNLSKKIVILGRFSFCHPSQLETSWLGGKVHFSHSLHSKMIRSLFDSWRHPGLPGLSGLGSPPSRGSPERVQWCKAGFGGLVFW